MAQPLPCLVQFAIGPAVPVASMNTSAAKRIVSFPRFPDTALMEPPTISTSSILVERNTSIPDSRSSFLTIGSMVATL